MKRFFALICTLAVIISMVQMTVPYGVRAEETQDPVSTETVSGQDDTGEEAEAPETATPTPETAEAADGEETGEAEPAEVTDEPAVLSAEGEAFVQAAAQFDAAAYADAETALYDARLDQLRNPEDEEAAGTVQEAEDAFKGFDDSFKALQESYAALSDTDKGFDTVSAAENALLAAEETLQNSIRTYFLDGADGLGEDADEVMKAHLLNVYNDLTEEQKQEEDVVSAYAQLGGESDPADKMLKAPGAEQRTALGSISITGNLKFADSDTEAVLTLPKDMEFFQYEVTVNHPDNTADTYTTDGDAGSSCRSQTGVFDLAYTIAGIPYYDPEDTVTVKAVPDHDISSFTFDSTSAQAAIAVDEEAGTASAEAGTLTLSIKKVNFVIHDTVLEDEGAGTASSYSGTWVYKEGEKSTAARNMSFRKDAEAGTYTAVIPSGAYVNVKASHAGYMLSSASEPAGKDEKISGENVEREYVWVQKKDETFVKEWLDDGTRDHADTPDLMNLQYSLDQENWKDLSDASEVGASEVAEPQVQTNADASIYRLTYTGLPAYMLDSEGKKVQIFYRLNEAKTPSGYTVARNDDGSLTNTKEYEFSFTVNWKDSRDAEGIRPDMNAFRDMLLNALHNGESGGQENLTEDQIEIKDNGNGTWTAAIHGLSAFSGTKENPNTYYLDPSQLQIGSSGSEASYEMDADNTAGVHENAAEVWNGGTLNYIITKKKSFDMHISWEDLYRAYRPDAYYHLYRYTDDASILEAVKSDRVPDDNENTITFASYDVYDSEGKAYTYILKETLKNDKEGYTVYYDGSKDRGQIGEEGTILNKDERTATTIRVEKSWKAKGTSLKITGYTVQVGLKRSTNGTDWETVKDESGNPLTVSIDGFADYNELTKRGKFENMPLFDANGNFYQYMPYEVLPEKATSSKGTDDGTLDAGDSFNIDGDTYTVTKASSADCSVPNRKLDLDLVNTLSGTVRFSIHKTWVDVPKETSIDYEIHQVDAYDNDKVVSRQTYAPENPETEEWAASDPGLLLPLYNEKDQSRYTYYAVETSSGYRKKITYKMEDDTTGIADQVEHVYMKNMNGKGGGDGLSADVNLKKQWIDGGDTSVRQPVTIKMFRIDDQGRVDRPAEWDEKGIGVYVLSEDTGWQVSDYIVFTQEEYDRYFKESIGHTYQKENLSEKLTYREVKVGSDAVEEGDNSSYDHVDTTARIDNASQDLTYDVIYTYDAEEDRHIIRNARDNKVVYEIHKEWFDGHYLSGRPDVTFQIRQNGSDYASVTVSVGENGKASASFTVEGKDVSNDDSYTFTLGTGKNGAALNDYILKLDGLPYYDEKTGEKYRYTCTEICNDASYTDELDPILDAGFHREVLRAEGKNNDSLKIERYFRNRRVQQPVSVSFTKEWKDNNNSLQIRPDLKLELAVKVHSAGHEDQLIPIQADFYSVSQDNRTFAYSTSSTLPRYVDTDLIAMSNGKLSEDDLGAEVEYYAAEAMDGEGSSQYQKSTEIAVNGSSLKDNNKEYISNGSRFINTLHDDMEARGTVLFSNVPFVMSEDETVMPKSGDLTFTLYCRSDDGNADDHTKSLTENGYTSMNLTAELKKENNGTYTFTFYDEDGKVKKLPKYDDDGVPYRYSVEQSFSDGASADFSDVFEFVYVSRDLQVIDRYRAPKRSITVSKTFNTDDWTEEEKNAGLYPDVTIDLYRVPERAKFNTKNPAEKYRIDSVTFTGDMFQGGNVPEHTFDQLIDITPNGLRYQYCAIERKINGYSTSAAVNNAETSGTVAVMQDESSAYGRADFTNTFEKKETELTAAKVWGPTGLNSELIPENANSLLSFTISVYDEAGLVRKYEQGTDFDITFSSTDSAAYQMTLKKHGTEDPFKLRIYNTQGKRYRIVLHENTDTEAWKAGGELYNFRCSTNNATRYSDGSYKGTLNLGTIVNTYGRRDMYVTKQWEDNYNKNGLRPRNITVKLQYKLSTETDDAWKDVTEELLGTDQYSLKLVNRTGTYTKNTLDGVTFELSGSGKDQNASWNNCFYFYNLPRYSSSDQKTEYQYRAVETAIDGDPLDTAATAASYKRTEWNWNNSRTTFRNEILPASVSATKTWDDASDRYDARPEALTLYLQRKSGNGGWEYVKHTYDGSDYTVSVDTSKDTWRSGSAANNYSVDQYLPREDHDGNTYAYRLTEAAPGTENIAENDPDRSGITVKGKNGTLSYTGTEDTENKLTEFTNNTDITNKLDRTTELYISKIWQSGGLHPESVTVVVRYKDATTNNKYVDFRTPLKIVLNAAMNWETTVTGLPLTGKDGSARTYTAYELNNEGTAVTESNTDLTLDDEKLYRVSYAYTEAKDTDPASVTITNTKRTTITVVKEWNDGKNREVTRPSALTIKCSGEEGNSYANASKAIDISETDDQYEVSFTVDQYGTEGLIDYAITEEGEGSAYGLSSKAELTGSEEDAAELSVDGEKVRADKLTLTNTHEIEVFDLTLNKSWKDSENKYDTRPDAVTMHLQYSLDGNNWSDAIQKAVENKDFTNAYADAIDAGYTTSAQTQQLEKGSTRLTWENLPVYANVKNSGSAVKTIIQYRVVEDAVNGYNKEMQTEVKADGTKGNRTVELENKLETTAIKIQKNWDDDENYNKQRPGSITVNILQNGKKLTDVELNAENGWKYELNDLPKESGKDQPYTYSIEEAEVPGYTSVKNGMTLTNTVDPVGVTLSLTKNFDHWEKAPEGFTFTLAADEKNPKDVMSSTDTVTIDSQTENHTASFDAMTYDHIGTYSYTITETDGDVDGLAYDWDKDAGKQRIHNVAVRVYVAADKTLQAEVKYDGSDDLIITNTYNPVKVNLAVEKYFNDWTKTEKGFTFDLTAGESQDTEGNKITTPMPADSKANVTAADSEPQTKEINAKTYTCGTAEFAEIAFEKAGTYQYTITEENSGEDGISYDTAAYPVTVTVTKADDASNALSAEVKYGEADALEITNTFTPVDVNLAVTKSFNDWTKAESFTFDLTTEDEKAPVSENMSAAATEEDQTADFETLTFVKAGTYQYTINERNDHMDGVSYDVSDHQVKAAVTKADDATNALSAEVTYDEDQESLTIQNTYTPTSAAIRVKKSFNGWEEAEYEDLFEDAVFTIDLKAVKNAPMPAGTDSDGTARVEAVKNRPAQAFGSITYEHAGVYHYTLQEENGHLDGVDYDTEGGTEPVVHDVTVTVTRADDATNALSASVRYDDGQKNLTIVNTFTPADPPLEATKSFNAWGTASGFTFRVSSPEAGTPMPEVTEGVATELEPTVVFSGIRVYQTGVYRYEIREDNDGIANITYDDTVHTAEIIVTKADDATNALRYEIVYDGNKDYLTIRNVYTDPRRRPLPTTNDASSSDGGTSVIEKKTPASTENNPENNSENNSENKPKLPRTNAAVNTGVEDSSLSWLIVLLSALFVLYAVRHERRES